MPAPVYAFDPVGTLLANKIVNEQHAVNESVYNTYAYIVPIAAPFHAAGLVVRNTVNGVTRVLAEGIDYNTAMPFIGASRSIGTMLYGGITLNSVVSQGTISLDYQTLGGVWVADVAIILATLANKVNNPKLIVWDNITNVQQTFPPINHALNFNATMGQDALVAAVTGITNEIAIKAAGRWRTISVATQLSNGDAVLCDTTLAPFSVMLPAVPVPNVPLRIGDYNGQFALNPVTILNNGNPIMGLMVPMIVSTAYRNITLQYIDAQVGWKITSN